MNRFRELDGLRAAAILGVVSWHFLGMQDGSGTLQETIFISGRSGVDLFFVLSGYLITRILLEQRDAPNYYAAFYGRRCYRILPVYAVMVAIYLVGMNFKGSAPVFFGGHVWWWSYLIGLQNYAMSIKHTYGNMWLAGTWSLAVEEQFYLLFPLIVLRLPPPRLPRLLLTLIVVCPVARAVTFMLGDDFSYYVLMPLRADVLAVGALIAWLEYSDAITPRIRAIFRLVFAVSVILSPIFVLYGNWGRSNMAIWGHTYLVALFGSMLFMIIQYRGSKLLAPLRSRIAEFFARISYALYLVHGNVMWATFMALGMSPTIATWRGAAVMALSFAISVAICAASYRWFEAPLILTGHRKFKYDAQLATQKVTEPLPVHVQI